MYNYTNTSTFLHKDTKTNLFSLLFFDGFSINRSEKGRNQVGKRHFFFKKAKAWYTGLYWRMIPSLLKFRRIYSKVLSDYNCAGKQPLLKLNRISGAIPRKFSRKSIKETVFSLSKLHVSSFRIHSRWAKESLSVFILHTNIQTINIFLTVKNHAFASDFPSVRKFSILIMHKYTI